MNNKVSIIMPAYNAEKYIGRALRSILNQTFKDWDLIIINDGSTDHTKAICEDACRNDKRIHLINQENKGSPKARETGVDSAYARNNDLITFVDADDEIPENALQILVELIIRYNADVCCGRSVKTINGITLPNNWVPPCLDISGPKLYSSEEIIDELIDSFFGISNLPVTLWGKMFKYQLIAENINSADIVKFTADDLIVTLNVMLKTKDLLLITDEVYKYRIGGGTSRYMPYLSQDFMSLYRYRKELIRDYSFKEYMQDSIDVELMYYLQTYFAQCVKYENRKNISFRKEAESLLEDTDVIMAARKAASKDVPVSEYACFILNKDYKRIHQAADDYLKKRFVKDLIKKIFIR